MSTAAPVSSPLFGDRLAFDFAVSQIRDTGYVNGNARVPLADERTPRSSDPAANAVIATLLTGFPDELPRRRGSSFFPTSSNQAIGSSFRAVHRNGNSGNRLCLASGLTDSITK